MWLDWRCLVLNNNRLLSSSFFIRGIKQKYISNSIENKGNKCKERDKERRMNKKRWHQRDKI